MIFKNLHVLKTSFKNLQKIISGFKNLIQKLIKNNFWTYSQT